MAKKLTKKASVESLSKQEELILAKGTQRPFIVTSPTAAQQENRTLSSNSEKACFAALLLFACVVRLQKLSEPNSVVFDEVHFGGFSKKYVLGEFFMDVHPPLAKMLFAGIASLGGFVGDFGFEKIGDIYPETVPYALMRFLPAILGVFTVGFMYLTLRSSGCSPIICLMMGAAFTIENANVTISRYILLDTPMMFFIAASAYLAKKLENQTPFSLGWYKALFGLAISLGLSVSSKWVGLFTIAWVGAITVWDLWFTIGDLTFSTKNVVKLFFVKLFVLLAVPFAVYMVFFKFHFDILKNEGEGSAFMSSAFRSQLEGNIIPQDTLADVGVNSHVTIRHVNTHGGYLHSHNHLYETGSQQQQITLYPHLDENNVWILSFYNETERATEFQPILDGSKIRLQHALSQRRLHSHDHRPPVSEQDWQNEVSAYGFEGFEGDANDDFIVEIVSEKSKKGLAQTRLRSIETVFRLRHAMTGCYLFSHEVKLPKWAWEQQEVTCATQGIKPLSLWYVETNENEFLPKEAEHVGYEPMSFWAKFVELHKTMWKINSGLTDPHNYESTPDEWPLLSRGINYWVKDNRQVYFMGNAVMWWSTTAFILGFAVYAGVTLLKWQAGFSKFGLDNAATFNFNVQSVHYILGWLAHYAPFFLMGRQMFLHHYLPAYYFGLMALAHFFQFIYSRINKNVGLAVLTVFLAASSMFYLNYAPLIYARPWTKSACASTKWMTGWDYDCNSFPEDLVSYHSPTALAQPEQTPIDFEQATPVVKADDIEEPISEGVESATKEEVSTVGEPNAERVGETEQIV